MPIIEPSTGTEIGTVAAGDAEDLERAVGAARRSFEDGRWRDLAPLDKEKRLRRLAELFAEHATVFGDLDTLDAGLLRAYTDAIVQFAIAGLDYYAGWPSKITGTIPATSPDVVVNVTREPLGVVGIIVPWNGPAFVINFVVAALACGNSVVLKPAEQTPMSATLMGQLCQDAGIPPGVVNVLHGTGEVIGAGLVEHRDVDAIGFTGSVETGRRIQAAAAARLKRVALELGGKSAHIFFDDCDLEPAAATAAGAVWGASGQVCTAGTRVLVQRGIYEEFMLQVKANTESMVIGSPFAPDTQVGPVVSAEQLERVTRYVDIGSRRGSRGVPRRQAPRRHRLLLRADDLHRRRQLDAHRPGGDLRPGDVRHPLRHRGGGDRHRQRRRVRPGVGRVDQRPRPRPPRVAGDRRRHRVGQHLRRGADVGALRRDEAVGPAAGLSARSRSTS